MLRLRLLGSFLLEVDGTPAPRLRSRVGESLLTLLTLRAGQPIERLWLAGVLWPESSHEQGLYNLRRNLTDLRTALGSESWRLESPSKLTLSLDLSGTDCDVFAFDAALAAQRWAAAVAGYGGALLTSGEETWLEAERLQREQGYLLALERAAELLAPAEALTLLERARSLDPLRESVVRALMQCHQRLGSPARAAQCYHDLRAFLLSARLGSPAVQTQALYGALTGPPTTSWDNLPEPLNVFVGRTSYLELCGKLLSEGQSRLVTLIGMGGIGKTRIAREVAARLRPFFTGGVVWVDLEGTLEAESNALYYRLAAALGVTLQPTTALPGFLVTALRGKRVLLVLDSAEQCVGVASQIHELLVVLPELSVLVASRRALDLQAEKLLEVAPLSPDETKELFLVRGKTKLASFAQTSENAEDLRTLCERLEGIPLAVELAAARIATLSPRELLQRLHGRFRLLQSTAHDLLPRQRTLCAALDSSYALLESQERRVFAQLSVFAGGFYLQDAESICVADDVLESVHALRRHSLLQAETEPRYQRVRYRFLETVAEYARERLREEMPVSEQVFLAHAQHFAALAQQLRQQFRTLFEAEALEQLERERLNLQAAQTCQELSAPERGACALALAGLLTRRGFVRTAQEPLAAILPALTGALRVEALGEWAGLCLDLQEGEQAEAAAQESLVLAQSWGDPLGTARAQNLLGQVALYRDERERARCYFTEALLGFEAQESTEAAFVHNNLGLIEGEEQTGDLPRAQAHFARALHLYGQQNNLRGIARVENNAGYVAFLWGAFPQAAQHYQRASTAARCSGDLDLLAKALNNLGETAQAQGNREQAQALYTEALALFREIDSPYALYTQDLLQALERKK